MRSIRCSAPGRAGIIGNPSDMYGGTVISCAVPLRARCTLEPAARLTFQSRERLLAPDTLELQSDEFDVCRVALRGLGFTVERAPFMLRIETDIPPQSGLAGSSALLTAIVACLMRYQQEAWGARHQLAERVRRIEAQLLQVACGYQDFYMAVFGGLNLMDFRDKELLG
ncbi:MAG: galactokinase family protein, partial [Fimbriimonadales bacterium]